MAYGGMKHIPEGYNHSFDLIFQGSSEARLVPVSSNGTPPLETASSSAFASLLCDSALDARQPTEASREIRALRRR